MSFLLFFDSDFEQVFTCKETNNTKVTDLYKCKYAPGFSHVVRDNWQQNLTFNIIIHVFEFTLSIFLFCYFVCL